MENTLFIYRRYINEDIAVADLLDSKTYSDPKIWEHIATVEPKSFIQTILSENKAIVCTMFQP